MKTSRLLSTLMIAALLFVVFHDFAINKSETSQHNSYMSPQYLDIQHSSSGIAMEHQSFHQPFLIAPDCTPLCSPLREVALYENTTNYSHSRSFDIFSPPKA